MRNEFESCTNCIYSDDDEPLCILRLCKHAIARTKECYVPKVQPSFPQRHENDCISRADAIKTLGEEPEVWSGNDEYAQGLNNQWHYDVNALKAMPSAQAEQRWIPFRERTPKEGQQILACSDDGVMWMTAYNSRSRFSGAWMPLPEPYKEDQCNVCSYLGESCVGEGCGKLTEQKDGEAE